MFKSHRAPIIFGIVAIGALAAGMLLFRSSPGDLAAAHAAVAGSSFIGDCRKCHAPAGLSAGCRSCHTEIDAQVAAKSGYHGKVIAAKVANCAPCHSDHNGKVFALVNKVSWGGEVPKTYEHAHVEYKIKGAHAVLACTDCHVKRAPVFTLPRFQKNPRAATFLGLSQDCMSCHKDPHAGGRASDCLKCHSQDKWKPAPGFDHDKFYPLRDEHAKVSCAKCHSGAPVAPGIFGKTLGKKCADCHKTPHRTKWKLECGACHTERAVPWATGNLRMTKPQHETTGYRLVKPHEKTACKACHELAKPYASRYSAPPREAKACEACHKDAHAGQFLPKRPRCIECHKEIAFKPAHFGVKEHSIYPLKGGHEKAECASCHIRDAALGAVRFVKVRSDCAFCHKDPHAGQFREGGKTSCESCHRDAASWKTLVFDHDTARFKLDAAHIKVACKECHPAVSAQNGRRVILYKPVRSACSDCHSFSR